MWALVEGNFGTAYRHRGEFVWVAILFAGLGIDRILMRWRGEGDAIDIPLLGKVRPGSNRSGSTSTTVPTEQAPQSSASD